MEKIIKNTKNKGITLIALVITVIVLLILAGISISMLAGNNSILNRTIGVKEETIVGKEKEQVGLAYMSAVVNKNGENVSEEDLQKELNISIGNNKTKVTEKDDKKLNVLFYDTTHSYTVYNGNVSKVEYLKLYISNYAELLDFANRVNNGETFENYIVYLQNDIEMETDDWVIIGTPGNRDVPGTSFGGIFEGNNHTINNFKVTTSSTYTGLFCINNGTIQNLNIRGVLSGSFPNRVGFISGANLGCINNCNAQIQCDITSGVGGHYELALGGITGANSGTIKNCNSSGEITVSGGTFSSTGGIAGENCGIISNCRNSTSINSGTENNGGIAGRMGFASSKIEQCINYGTISVDAASLYNGGVIGRIHDGMVSECSNKGDYNVDGSRPYLGGICGWFDGTGQISNCYVTGTGTREGGHIAGIVAENIMDNNIINNCYVCGLLTNNWPAISFSGGNITNCYYNKDIITNDSGNNATGLTTEEMKNSNFLSNLGNKFKADINNINEGYPILRFE